MHDTDVAGGYDINVTRRESSCSCPVRPLRRAWTTHGCIWRRELADVWSKSVRAKGFTIVPNLLLDNQAKLGLSPTELAIIIHLLRHAHEKVGRAFPGNQLVASRLGTSPRQLQRIMQELERKGFVRRQSRFNANGGRQSNLIDFQGLSERVHLLLPQGEDPNAVPGSQVTTSVSRAEC